MYLTRRYLLSSSSSLQVVNININKTYTNVGITDKSVTKTTIIFHLRGAPSRSMRCRQSLCPWSSSRRRRLRECAPGALSVTTRESRTNLKQNWNTNFALRSLPVLPSCTNWTTECRRRPAPRRPRRGWRARRATRRRSPWSCGSPPAAAAGPGPGTLYGGTARRENGTQGIP